LQRFVHVNFSHSGLILLQNKKLIPNQAMARLLLGSELGHPVTPGLGKVVFPD